MRVTVKVAKFNISRKMYVYRNDVSCKRVPFPDNKMNVELMLKTNSVNYISIIERIYSNNSMDNWLFKYLYVIQREIL